MKEIIRYYNDNGTIVNKKQASKFEKIIYTDNNKLYQVWKGKIILDDNDNTSDITMDMLDAALQQPEEASGMEFQAGLDPVNIKQDMTIDDIVTPDKLDQDAEDILGSLENDVIKILKKTKYFDKVGE